MKKLFQNKLVLFFFFGLLVGAAITFGLMARSRKVTTVQPVDSEFLNRVYRENMKLDPPIDNYRFSGSCGDLVNWYLTEDGGMYIQGSGAMWDFASSAMHTEYYPVPQWYDYREEITSLVVLPGVTAIGGHAFAECYNLSQLVLPDGLEAVEEDAFLRCHSLTEVVLPDTVTEIGSAAFCGCDNLASINIPSAAAALYSVSFNGCSSLGTLVIPPSIKTIEKGCFANCRKLKLMFEGSNPTWKDDERAYVNFFADTEVEICYPSSDASWKDFNSEGMGGMVTMTPYSREKVSETGS